MVPPQTPPEDDPLDLESVDREIRLERLRRQLEEIAGGPVASGRGAECTPELEEAFLESVLRVETHGSVRPFDTFVNEGLELPPPQELDGAALEAKLWELIQVMADHRLYLHSTDHLSDRELYEWLWSDGLREEMFGFGLPSGNCHLDVLGGGSAQDTILQMRYYTDDDERARWAAEFPDFPMPPKEKPPFDRDRHLPKPGY